VEERSVHTGKVAGSIPARTTVYPQPHHSRLGVLWCCSTHLPRMDYPNEGVL